jgi:hypothetical protein
MNGTGYPPDHSFANRFAADKSDQIRTSTHALIEYLSLNLTPEDIVELSRQLRQFSDAELYSLNTTVRCCCTCCEVSGV